MIDFQRSSSSPVLAKGGTYDGWVADGIAAPCWTNNTTPFAMQVSLWDNAQQKWASAFFTSTDLLTWSYVSGSLRTPSGGAYIKGNSGLAYWHGKYWHAYNQYPGFTGTTIWLESSTDLVNWTSVSSNVLNEADAQYDPSLSVNPNGSLELWYIRQNAGGRTIRMASCTDPTGATWGASSEFLAPAVWNVTNFGEPSVCYVGTARHLVLDVASDSGKRQIGHFISINQDTTWATFGTALGPAPFSSWEQLNVFDGEPRLADNGDGRGNILRLLYAGSNIAAATDDTQSSIGLGYLTLPAEPAGGAFMASQMAIGIYLGL